MTGELLEVCGLSGSGKTQFCLTIAASVTVKLKQKVYYIDCKNDFSGTRMQSILETYGLKDEVSLIFTVIFIILIISTSQLGLL
jgi:RecA/RadA recombinase